MADYTKLKRRKRLRGTVVSAGKMAKTITVLVERRPRHPQLRKQYRRSKAYLAHDPKNEARTGDHVIIEETRPLSKRKHFRLIQVEKRDERRGARAGQTGEPGKMESPTPAVAFVETS